MKYDYQYEVDECGTIRLNNLPFVNRYVEIPREEQFRNLYKYVLIDIDINYAIGYLELCTNSITDLERQCFFRMAVILYAKCYLPAQNGGRPQLNAAKVYKGLPDDPLGCHDKIIEMRNKYFAHDENDFKTSKLGAVLNMDDHRMEGIAYPRMQAKFDYNLTIDILMKLCKKTKEWVGIKLDEEIERIYHYIEQRDFDELNGYENIRVFD